MVLLKLYKASGRLLQQALLIVPMTVKFASERSLTSSMKWNSFRCR